MSSPVATTSGADVLLRCHDITRRWGGLVAVDRFSTFSLFVGER